jgi:hypothetical protein
MTGPFTCTAIPRVGHLPTLGIDAMFGGGRVIAERRGRVICGANPPVAIPTDESRTALPL